MSQEPKARDAEVAEFRAAVLNKLTYAVGKDPEHAFDHDWFEAIALAARDHMVDHWMDHTRLAYRRSQKSLLPLPRVPNRALAVRQPEQPGAAGRRP